MRPRFSLRTLFIITTVLAVACYWFVLPTLTARRFVGAVTSGNYRAADGYFSDDGDRFLAAWSEDHWGFQPRADLLPLSFAQLFQGQRRLQIEIRYFELDQNVRCNVKIAVSPMGLKTLSVSPKQRRPVTIDSGGFSLPSTPIR